VPVCRWRRTWKPTSKPCWTGRRRLGRRGRATPQHADTVYLRVRGLLQGIGARHLSEVRAEAVGRYLAERRAKAEPDETPRETAGDGGAGDKGPRDRRPKLRTLSVRTSNHVLQNAQSFFAWLIRARRASENPLVSLSKIQVTEKARKLVRRPLEHAEAAALLTATRPGPARFGMEGEARYWLYRLALETGLRSSELRSLKRENLCLESDEPHVWLPADNTKNRKPAELPLRPETVADVEAFVSTLHPAAVLFPAMPARWDVADMLREDLAVAAVEAETDAGRVDFHSLRVSCLSWLAAAGTPVKDLQEFARHSDPKLTMNIYTHTLRGSLAGAAARLPNLSTPAAEGMRATGTCDVALRGGPPVGPRPAHSGALSCNDLQTGKVPSAGRNPRELSGRTQKTRDVPHFSALRPAGFEPATPGLGNRCSIH